MRKLFYNENTKENLKSLKRPKHSKHTALLVCENTKLCYKEDEHILRFGTNTMNVLLIQKIEMLFKAAYQKSLKQSQNF